MFYIGILIVGMLAYIIKVQIFSRKNHLGVIGHETPFKGHTSYIARYA